MCDVEKLNTEKLLVKLKSDDEIFNKLQEQYNKIIEEQEVLFKKYLNKLMPCIEFIHSKRYRFIHPSIKYVSSKGPILGYNSKNNFLYVYDIKTKYPRKINMYNTDEMDFVSYKEIFELEGFENALQGLLYVPQIYEKLIKEIKQEIEINKELLNKYNID